LARLLSRFGEDGEQDCREDRYDGDDNEQFDEREAFTSVTAFHFSFSF
jgi:hypothetical protein